jgi:hypothetical protein
MASSYACTLIILEENIKMRIGRSNIYDSAVLVCTTIFPASYKDDK